MIQVEDPRNVMYTEVLTSLQAYSWREMEEISAYVLSKTVSKEDNIVEVDIVLNNEIFKAILSYFLHSGEMWAIRSTGTVEIFLV